MNREYRTQSNYHAYNEKHEIVNGEYFNVEEEPSLTIPDRALTVRELLERFTRGGEVRVLKPQNITEDPEEFGLDLNQLSKMERVELLHETKEQVKSIRADLVKKADKSREIEKAAEKKAAEKAKDAPTDKDKDAPTDKD